MTRLLMLMFFHYQVDMQRNLPSSMHWSNSKSSKTTSKITKLLHPLVCNMASFQRVHNRTGERFQFVPRKYTKRREKSVDLSRIAALCVPCATFKIETKSLPDLYLAKLVYHKSHIPPRNRSIKSF